jgi:hypothetical protein
MIYRKTILGSALALLVCLPACNQPFDPKGPFEEKLVVYSILLNDQDLQFVRVYSNYDVHGFDPFQNTTDRAIPDAHVIASGPGSTYSFRDTLLPRQDTSRYDTPIAAYVTSWRPEPGKTYTLTVSADGLGSTSATVTLPQRSSIRIFSDTLQLDIAEGDTLIVLGGTISPLATGYSGQLLIEYTALSGSQSIEQRVEVPTTIEDQDFQTAVYPAVRRVTDVSLGVPYLFVKFQKAAYVAVLTKVYKDSRYTKITFKRAIFRFLQAEQNFFDYYNVVRHSRDPLSIRLDEPDLTNLSSGFGVFGGCTIDSLVHSFPNDFLYNR